MSPRRAIIIGGTAGIGLEMARQLVAGGWKVAVVGRNFSRLIGLDVIQKVHDVSNVEEVERTFVELTDALGGLDLFVYSSGVMPPVGPEEFDFEKDDSMLTVNVRGLTAWMNLAAARFQGSGSGCLMTLGSVAGDRGRRGQPVYNATKAYAATYTEGLRNRLAEKGVSVVTIKPGPVKTELIAHLNFRNPMPVEVAAAKCVRLIGKQGEFYLNPAHRLIFAILRLLPSPVFRRLKI